nr:MAG TPA: hypothetical protein [Caudoviricetes sp.]
MRIITIFCETCGEPVQALSIARRFCQNCARERNRIFMQEKRAALKRASQPERAAQPADWNDVTETISNLVDPKPGVCYVVRNRISGRVLADRQNQVIYFPDVATAYNYLDRHYQCGEAYRLERRYL